MGQQINPQITAMRVRGSVYRARAAEPMTVAATGNEAEEGQHLFDRDLRSDLGKIDSGHDRSVFAGTCRIGPLVKAEQRRGSGNHPVDLCCRLAWRALAAAGVADCLLRWAR